MIKCIRIYDQLGKGKDQFYFADIRYKNFYYITRCHDGKPVNISIFDSWEQFANELSNNHEPSLEEFKAAYDEMRDNTIQCEKRGGKFPSK